VITSEYLETAFWLLERCKGNPKELDVLVLAISVLAAYGWITLAPFQEPKSSFKFIPRRYWGLVESEAVLGL
jgi:hypothetical protein